MYFIDTNVIIDAIRGTSPSITAHFKECDASDIALFTIVVAELEYGARHSDNYEKRKNQYLEFIAPYSLIPFTEYEAVIYGKIRQQLAADGKIIGSNDMLIAAVAMSYAATIVTHNTDEFSRVNGLNIEDWRD